MQVKGQPPAQAKPSGTQQVRVSFAKLKFRVNSHVAEWESVYLCYRTFRTGIPLSRYLISVLFQGDLKRSGGREVTPKSLLLKPGQSGLRPPGFSTLPAARLATFGFIRSSSVSSASSNQSNDSGPGDARRLAQRESLLTLALFFFFFAFFLLLCKCVLFFSILTTKSALDSSRVSPQSPV